MIIFLIGFMGCGKTEIGQVLATRLNLPFFDTDHLIEQKEGASVAQIFENKGESHFRTLETELIRSYSFPNNCIVSTGGGLPCHNKNMEYLLARGMTIYLKAPTYLLIKFLIDSTEKKRRPLLKNCTTQVDMQQRVQELMQEREAYYLSAKLVFNVVKDREFLLANLEKLAKHLESIAQE